MLSFRVLTAVTATLIVLATAQPALAEGGQVTCPPAQPICIIVVTGPGTPGGGGTGGSGSLGPRVCTVPGTSEIVPCQDPVWGWWSNLDGCYYKRLEPPPPATAPEWRGNYPQGAIYQATCPGSGGTGGGWTWFSSAPDGYGGVAASPAALAQQAVNTMRLTGPDIGMAPTPGKTGLVGLPVWLWTAVSATTWGPASATAAVPGLSVTATARAKQIVWDMGDGHTVTCANPGTPYTTAKGDAESPTCGHVYTDSSASRPDQVFTVTATTTWAVTWTGGGESGALTVTRSSTTQARIGELQVLVS